VLTVLAEALRIYPEIEVIEYQRLADFHKYGCAIAQALGKTAEDFNEAYKQKVECQAEETINADQASATIFSYLEQYFAKNTTAISKEPTDFYNDVTTYARDTKHINTDKFSSTWPKSAQAFNRKLNKYIPSLQKKGFEVVVMNGTPRTIAISKTLVQKQLPTGDKTPEQRIVCYQECAYFDKSPCKHNGKLNQQSEQPKDCKNFIARADVQAREKAAYQRIIDLSKNGTEATDKTVGDPEAIRVLQKRSAIFEVNIGVYQTTEAHA
jgi:hypothetical protein